MQHDGFSLLELLIVICIAAILATVGIQGWKALQRRNELTITTQQLAYFLNEVQVDAYTNNRTYHLYLFTSPWCLTIAEQEKPPTCHGIFRFIKPDNSVEISGFTEKKTVSFWGRRNMAQTVSFQLKNEIGISKVIVSFRGRVRVCSQKIHLAGIPAC